MNWFKAYVEQGHWSTEVRKLSALMGKTIEETVRAQAKLLVRDCILLTPPCPKTFTDSGTFKARLESQREIGMKAVARDVTSVMVHQRSRKAFSITGNKRSDKIAEHLAMVARWGNMFLLRETMRKFKLLSANNAFTKVRPWAMMEDYKEARELGGRSARMKSRVLIHQGQALDYNPEMNKEGGWKIAYTIRRIVEEISENMGRAKAGWAPAAKAVKLGLPKWIRSHRKKKEGAVKIEGAGTPKISITISSSVPYMQRKGAIMRIVERAWQMRQNKIIKQRRIFENRSAKARAMKWKLTKDQDSTP